LILVILVKDVLVRGFRHMKLNFRQMYLVELSYESSHIRK